MKLSKRQAEALGIVPLEAPGGPKAASGAKSDPEPARRAFRALCAAHGLPEPVPEYRFAEKQGRRWQFDWLFDGWLAVEQDGGTYGRGRPCPTCGRRRGGAHSSIKDLKRDQEKLNAAVILGYAVLRFRPEQFKDGSAFPVVKAALSRSKELP